MVTIRAKKKDKAQLNTRRQVTITLTITQWESLLGKQKFFDKDGNLMITKKPQTYYTHMKTVIEAREEATRQLRNAIQNTLKIEGAKSG